MKLDTSTVLTVLGLVITLSVYGIGIAQWTGAMNTRMDGQDKQIDALVASVANLASRVNIERDINLERDVKETRKDLNLLTDAFNQKLNIMKAQNQRDLNDLTKRVDSIDETLKVHWLEIQQSATYGELEQVIKEVDSLRQEILVLRNIVGR